LFVQDIYRATVYKNLKVATHKLMAAYF